MTQMKAAVLGMNVVVSDIVDPGTILLVPAGEFRQTIRPDGTLIKEEFRFNKREAGAIVNIGSIETKGE